MSQAPIDTRDMLGVHAVLREQYAALPSFTQRAQDLGPDQVAVVADHCALLNAFVHAHHVGEDETVWPILRDRAAPSIEIVDGLEEEHHELVELTSAAETACNAWRDEPTDEHCAAFLAAAQALDDHLADHLDREEAAVLPLIASTFTAAEYAAVGEHSRSLMAQPQLAIILGYINAASPEAGELILADMPPQAREGWLAFGRPAYEEYRARVES